eukprot:EG_transcript_12799
MAAQTNFGWGPAALILASLFTLAAVGGAVRRLVAFIGRSTAQEPLPLLVASLHGEDEVCSAEAAGLDPLVDGFDRPRDFDLTEIHTSMKRPVANHFLVSTSLPPVAWPKDVQEASPVLRAVVSAFPKGQTPAGHLYYAAESSGELHSILWYPQRTMFTGVTESNVSALAASIARGALDDLPAGVASSPITDTRVFVCAHRSRDSRCGYCGAALHREFQAELRAQQAEGTTRVHKVSHVGGHKYAGLVLIYGPAVLDWYAYVRPSDVPDLVKEAVVGQQWLPRLWRGRVAASPEETAIMRGQCREFYATGTGAE